MKLIYPILIVVLFSCSGQSVKNNERSESVNLEQDSKEETIKIENLELLENGLSDKFRGDWLTVILPDSIIKSKEILRWKSVFYADLLISIHDNDTLIIRGNMDGIRLKYDVFDSRMIKLSEWNNTLTYSPEKDVIFLGGEKTGRAFKRLSNSELTNTISNEKLLMEYVIGQLFNEDYLPFEFVSKIKYISLGLETYTPFTFDAIGIENENGKIDYYGWKFSGDTLNLYETTSIFDDDSGFASYKIGTMKKQYY